MKRVVLLIASMLCLQLAFAANPKIKYGPWIQNVSETGFSVVWTSEHEALAHVEIAPEDGSVFNACQREMFVQTIAGRRYTGTFHLVNVTGLEPGKKYRYRIVMKNVEDDMNPYGSVYGVEKTMGEYGAVKTADNSRKECNFVVFNDTHQIHEKYKKLAEGVDPAKVDLVVFNGDMVSHMTYADSLINHLFNNVKKLTTVVPSVYARGNHEGRGREWYKFQDVFPTSTGETYFFKRYGPVGFIVLDGGEDKPDSSAEYSGTAAYDQFREKELEWLKEVVKNPDFVSAPVKIAIMHIPPLANKGSWYSQLWLNDHFTPVLNEAGVDLMLSGHHHTHFLTKPGEFANKFPILVNSNQDRLDVKVTETGIKVNVVDQKGVVIHTYEFAN
jgi:predicted phosphodiesterase